MVDETYNPAMATRKTARESVTLATPKDSLDRELSTQDIGKIIMRRLKALDKVAYVRFASVYLEFADVSEFMSELKVLVGSRTPVEKKKKLTVDDLRGIVKYKGPPHTIEEMNAGIVAEVRRRFARGRY